MLTQAAFFETVSLRQKKTVAGIGVPSVTRRSDTRAIRAGFSMVRCVGAPSGAPFLVAVTPILRHLATRDWRLSGRLNSNTRRPLVSANTRTVSTDTIDKLYGRAQNIQGAAHALFLVSEEIEELNTDNASSVAFHILRNFIQQQAEKIMEEA